MRLALALAACLVVAGCGGSEHPRAAEDEIEAGAKVFTEAGCGDCHTFAPARATGSVGPDLDRLTPSREAVARKVASGGGGMPSFAEQLTDDEIDAVASFVSGSAAPARREQFTFQVTAANVESCGDEAACLQQAFGNLAFRDGPKAALERLQRMVGTNATVRANCHPIAHTIGAGGLLRFEGDVGKAFAAGSATCASGYYHGLLQWKLAGLSEDRALEVARRACAAPSIAANRFNAYQCVHGLGHGLMLYTGYHLPDALAMCHGLATEFDQTSCTGGVFMENLSSSFGLRSRWLDETDLLFPCPVVAERDKLYCYLLVTSRILPAVDWDWRKAADWCRRSESGWVATCFQSLGRDASGSAHQNAEATAANCSHAGSGERECVFGAVRDIVNNDSDDLAARRLCEIVDPAHRSYCFYGIGTILASQHATPAARRDACRRFARGRDLAECARGAGA